MVTGSTLAWYNNTVVANKNSHIELLTSENIILGENNKELIRKLEKSILQKDLFSIAMNTAQIVESIYNKPSSEYILRTSTVKQGNLVNTEFYLEHRVEFPPGEYSLEAAYKASNLIKAITTYTATIKKIYEKGSFPNTYSFHAEFQGGADNAGGTGVVGKYNGEFGTIVMNSVLVNGETVEINLSIGDSIKNSDLAFLRSYSVYKTYRELARKMPIDIFNGNIEFIANENQGYGQKYRYGKISVKILDLDEKLSL